MKRAMWMVASGALVISGWAFGANTENSDADGQSTRQVRQGKDARTAFDTAADNTAQDAKDTANQVDRGASRDEAKATQAVDKAADAPAAAGTSISQAANEATHPSEAPKLERGELRDGRPVQNSITTNALGLFGGEGINVQYERPIANKWSVLGIGRYSRTQTGGASVTAFGVAAGVDYFILGRHNEGLFIGPRLNLGAGAGDLGRTTLLGNIGAAGELGYNWIASNGITAGAAGGVNVQLTGSTQPNQNTGLSGANPYARVNVGYSW